MSNEIRTRFAPSPTGLLHVGGMRTALFAWLVARQAGGQFILRIEDTDRNRHVDGADQHIIDCLSWLGLDFDEGPIYQSQRVKDGVYQKWAEKLIESGRAYADPYSKEDLQQFREQAQKIKQPFLYRNHRPKEVQPVDGLNLLEGDEGVVIRFKSEPKLYKSADLVMGELVTGPEVVDDFILIKSDGFPTYNFAHIVDDLEMGVTHVIRGQEFLSSMPNYRNLYEALDEIPPIFATMPHIMNEQGNKKLSKRDGAKDILDYASNGYLPEAMINFLASLGWNDGTEQEIFSSWELIKKFDLGKVQKGGAQFDEQRLKWINGHHIRNMKVEELYKKVKNYWPEPVAEYDETYKLDVLKLVQERLKYFAELPGLTNFFFQNLPLNPELISQHKHLKKLPPEEIKSLLEKAKETLEQSDFSINDLTERLNGLLQTTNQKPSTLFSLIRVATTQSPASPALAETMRVLGKNSCLKRIKQQIENL